MKRVGILGGTFNPVHNGHINLARQLCRKLKLDRIIFVPAYIPPHKKVACGASSGERLEMVRLAIKNEKRLSVSDFEIRKKGKSYTIDTLRHFKRKFGPRAELFFLTGADMLKGLKKWKDLGGIFRLAGFVVAARPGYGFKKVFPTVKFVNIRPSAVSSTQIRKLKRQRKDIGRFVPKPVELYIRERDLYIP